MKFTKIVLPLFILITLNINKSIFCLANNGTPVVQISLVKRTSQVSYKKLLDLSASEFCSASFISSPNKFSYLPTTKQDYKKYSCVKTEKIIYEAESVTIQNCSWEKLIFSNQNFNRNNFLKKQVKDWKKIIRLTNLQVYFTKEIELTCSAELNLTENKKVKIIGPCAPQFFARYYQVNGATPTGNSLLLDALFKPDPSIPNSQAYLDPEMEININLPLPINVANYLQYMMSKEAIKDCNEQQLKHKH